VALGFSILHRREQWVVTTYVLAFASPPLLDRQPSDQGDDSLAK
jgi:hypothetical protein